MTLQVDFWYLVGLLLGFLALCGTGLQILLTQAKKHIDAQFATQGEANKAVADQLSKRLDAIESANKDEAMNWQRVERELLRLQADLPLQYVRREDYIRGQTVIEAKLDGLATRLENAQLRARSAP